eukprot:scaffold89194_cov31-Tisochrysis_lutea.AAC.2
MRQGIFDFVLTVQLLAVVAPEELADQAALALAVQEGSAWVDQAESVSVDQVESASVGRAGSEPDDLAELCLINRLRHGTPYNSSCSRHDK